jgi:hypothetical protein
VFVQRGVEDAVTDIQANVFDILDPLKKDIEESDLGVFSKEHGVKLLSQFGINIDIKWFDAFVFGLQSLNQQYLKEKQANDAQNIKGEYLLSSEERKNANNNLRKVMLGKFEKVIKVMMGNTNANCLQLNKQVIDSYHAYDRFLIAIITLACADDIHLEALYGMVKMPMYELALLDLNEHGGFTKASILSSLVDVRAKVIRTNICDEPVAGMYKIVSRSKGDGANFVLQLEDNAGNKAVIKTQNPVLLAFKILKCDVVGRKLKVVNALGSRAL